MVKLYSPKDEIELALIRSILDGESIPYFVHNDSFGSMEIGPRIELFNAKTIMVDEAYRDRARDLIADFLQKTQVEHAEGGSSYSGLNWFRTILEFALFGWIVPGRRRRKEKLDE